MPFVRCAGLHDHRPALRRARHVERTFDRVVLALVTQLMQLGWIEEQPALGIAHERVVVPAVPESGHDLREFARAAVAHRTRIDPGASEVARFHRLDRRDAVPAGAAVADVVERGEFAGDVIGLVVGRRCRRHQADAIRHARERRQQRQRLQVGNELHGAAERVHVRFARRHAVRQKDHVELGALGGLGDLDIVPDVDVGIDLRAWVPPRRDVMAGRIEVGGEPHGGAHGAVPHGFLRDCCS